MRTTLTLDDDLARTLKDLAHQQDEPFKSIVNRTIRAGLAALARPQKPREYRLEPVSMGGVAAGLDRVKALDLSDRLEDEALIRKLEQRK